MNLPDDVYDIIAEYGSCCDRRSMACAWRMYTPTKKSACVWRDWLPGKCLANEPPEYVAAMDAFANKDYRIAFSSTGARDAFLEWARKSGLKKYTTPYGFYENVLVHINFLKIS